ncbi:CoA transferase, partial [Microbacterium sp. ISL-103]|uniref:CoA transferase n=1 Tax=Microbacterium sp. ISL-103 TaxID=2819156 RepID=UPI001BED1A83
GLSPGSAGEAVATALERLPADEAVHLITVNGGLAVPVAREDRRADAELRATPLLDVERVDSPSVARSRASRPHVDAPLAGIRVLDLTRVIAGPVCTRTLALLGADVLRIDPPHLAEPEWQHLDTGHGKRSSLLDAHTDRLRELLDAADVVVLGYRPASLERLGLSPRALARQHPGVVIAQLSAWGIDHPHRAGFDSLVQAASGIAMIESPDGRQPGVLPAQALDHSAGYLLAAAVTALVRRQRREGGTWIVRTSLRRIAAELLGMPRRIDPEKAREFDAGAHTSSFLVDGSTVITASAALPGLEFAAPRRWGADQARW